jgi:large conductance mechanosensitive channel
MSSGWPVTLIEANRLPLFTGVNMPSNDRLNDPTHATFSLLEEFKSFIMKGNVVDLAVGVIIGGAFGKIVDSLVNHIIMPAIGMIMPDPEGYKAWKVGPILFGEFLGTVINFLVIAAAIWLFIVKFLGFLTKAKQTEAAAPPPPTKDQELLTEIRDLLRDR